ncbi:histidine kinase [Pseudopedobacter saltans DSM 12145]|uniref:histidine kinase n=1 Tax=Pseudopedobacter saltans (strain ATCC 51119 / DSM 12145 / JCM 21818 / CCUG 39354 / LMG 10337 / NBRC 100064 / NCIMB 13643) TaxID=762903 RepID=F0S758_PSESL|nr:hybrid sensor histidine kinase/response regulator transcription factor [Pseudopedobacter saltans]ADY54331.1 histidine kinase [Pseudopedobacter saltans DSM 12145]
MKKIVLFFLAWICTLNVFAKLSFDHISVIDGLSQSTVLSICKDSRGFLWLGTRDGLNRYDGKTIKQYKNDPLNPNSLISDDYIYAIAEDQNQKLWVGTQKGISYYSPETDSFEQIDYKKAGKNDPQSFAILQILPAKDGKVWFGTNDGLLYIENTTSRKFKAYNKTNGLAGNEVYAVFADDIGNIWVGTVTGLSKLSPTANKKSYTIKNYFNDKTESNSIGANFVRTIAQDNKGQIWFGTEKGGISLYQSNTDDFKTYTTKNSRLNNDIVRKIYVANDGTMLIGTMNGLCVYNPFSKDFQVYHHNPDNDKSINDNSIKDIYEDNNGSIWIGTNFGGVNVAHRNTLTFDIYNFNTFNTNSISGNLISVLARDKDGNLWIGTEGRGLNFYNTKTRRFTRYGNQESNTGSIGSNTIKSIHVDRKNNVWIGLFEGGLELFNRNTGGFVHYRPNSNNPQALNHGYISAIDEDVDGNIWIGTSTKGLNILDPKTNVFSHINSNTKGRNLNSDYIKDILVDSKGNIWIGTVSGINLLRKGSSAFVQILKGESGLVTNYINCIQEDDKGNIWVGTHKGGLSLYDPQKKKFRNYNKADGLISDNVVGINFDLEGNVWISTDNGLSVLNIQKQTFKNFDMNDGLPSSEFSVKSTLRDAEGNLYFGTYNGLISFKPEDIAFNSNPPKIVFTSLKLFNQTVKVNGEDGILDKDISFQDKLVFKASQNIFSIDFIAFNYINSSRNKYAYKLEGFEKEWNYVDNPSATYTNLPAGTYKLLVKAANNDGIWTDQPKELTIKVLPPIWKTWWAYLIYAILFVVIWYQINKFLRKQQKLETDLYYEQLNHEKQEELYQSKLEFFTKISHEIRTPLTLIFAPLERLIASTKQDPALNKQLYSIKNNTERLLHLISELLDFRKIDTGNLKLKLVIVSLENYCRQIFDSFKSQAQTKHIDFSFEANSELFVRVDIHQMEKVFFNLLSNAFKYTQEGGSVKLRLRSNQDFVFVDVQDNGTGIPKEDQEKIFDNFYQSKNETVKSAGWGIGLALAKNIVDLHGGDIFLDSRVKTQEETGFTCFTVKLNRVYATEGQLLEVDQELPLLSAISLEEDRLIKEEQIDKTNDKDRMHTVLVVEDNDELRTFLAQSLSGEYLVLEARDGVEGLDLALKEVPDIIVSDVTMPNMDGMEFCSLVKKNEVSSHIPVIMLTAMASHLHQVEGLESGANIYLTKPFSVQLLELHIRNLINSANALKEKFSKQVMLMPKNVEIEDPEEKFLNKLVQIVEDHMEDSDFNVSTLVDKIGMSQTVLYKKIKALTGMTITDFIKSLRLKRAAQLLEQRKLNISEVAYSVGFNDRKYFSKEFKKQFGKSPSEYIGEKSEGKDDE